MCCAALNSLSDSPSCWSPTTRDSPLPTPSNPRPAPPPPARRPAAPRTRTGTPRTRSPTSSPTSERSAATLSASSSPSTPSLASQHPPRSKPERSSYSTSSSTSSQSHTRPKGPIPAPTRGIRCLTTENLGIEPSGRGFRSGRSSGCAFAWIQPLSRVDAQSCTGTIATACAPPVMSPLAVRSGDGAATIASGVIHPSGLR